MDASNGSRFRVRFQFPRIDFSRWIVSILVRVGLPSALGFYCYSYNSSVFGPENGNVLWACGVMALAWMVHWVFAVWVKSDCAPRPSLIKWLLMAATHCFLWYAAVGVIALFLYGASTGQWGNQLVIFGKLLGVLGSFGFWSLICFCVAVRAVHVTYRERIVTRLPWWVARLGGYAVVFTWVCVALAVSACLIRSYYGLASILTDASDGANTGVAPMDPLLSGTWVFALAGMLKELSGAGALSAVVVVAGWFFIADFVERAIMTSITDGGLFAVRSAALPGSLAKTTGYPNAFAALIRMLSPVVSVLVCSWAALTLLCSLAQLALDDGLYPAQPTRDTIIAALFPGRLLWFWLGLVACFIVYRCVANRGRVHGFIKFLVWCLCFLAAPAGLIWMYRFALASWWVSISSPSGVLDTVAALISRLMVDPRNPMATLWGYIAYIVGVVVAVILALIVGIIVLVIVLSGDSGGGGGGGGGGGYAGGPGGSSSGGLFGGGDSRTLRSEGRRIGSRRGNDVYDRDWHHGRVSKNWDGSERVDINGTHYSISDSVIDDGKVVRDADGKVVGRIDEGLGGDTFHKED